MLSELRALTPSDVASAMELSQAANWNQTREDWLRVMRLGGERCRCVEDAGKIVATTTLLPYGTRLGWIGMVLTRAEYRRQGLAKRLMEDAIARAERDGIRALKLDATDEGRPLYESLGFVVEEAVERWGRAGGTVPAEGKARIGDARMSDELFALDEEAFGVSRRYLLEALADAGSRHVTARVYAMSREGTTARYLGPCVANSEAEAELLIGAHLAHSASCDWYWDLLPANEGAVRVAEKFGFTLRRRLWRMRRGEAMQNNNAMVYAIAGFELG